ncbi:MAG: AI-2E family transporter, partial [Actinobacteria bacterium]|nr:AI-2E family transporter [Actinomycetota bacterium]
TKIREKVYNFSNSFLLFILPGKRQVAIIFTFVLLLQFYGLKVFHRVLDKRSNSGFEFIAFFVTRVYSRLLAFFFIKSIDVVFVFILWLLALHLLQFDGAFQIALVAGLGILTPIFGMWLGGLFPLFYLQTSDNMIVQIVGVIITLAVIWLFRHIVIPREQFWDINRRTILVLLAIGYLFGNVVGLFIIVPLFVFVRFLVGTFLQGKPLYHKIQKETLPV